VFVSVLCVCVSHFFFFLFPPPPSPPIMYTWLMIMTYLYQWSIIVRRHKGDNFWVFSLYNSLWDIEERGTRLFIFFKWGVTRWVWSWARKRGSLTHVFNPFFFVSSLFPTFWQTRYQMCCSWKCNLEWFWGTSS
jgi:hypothetical protein